MFSKRTPQPLIFRHLVGLVVRLGLALCLEDDPDLTTVCSDATSGALAQFLADRLRARSTNATSRTSAAAPLAPTVVTCMRRTPSTITCPVCHGSSRNPEPPAELVDDDGTCLVCCFPLHPLYAAHHGYIRALRPGVGGWAGLDSDIR